MNEDNYKTGREGEEIIRNYLKKNGIPFFQADIIFKTIEGWFLAEIKKQEMYEPPPFWGHGLPDWQIKARLKFQKEMNVRAVLYIIDKKTEIVYWQYMDELIKGEQYQTHGKQPRLIFPIENFNILEL